MNIEPGSNLLGFVANDFLPRAATPQRTKKWLYDCLSNLDSKKLIILTGPPGIGKSWVCDAVEQELINSRILQSVKKIDVEVCVKNHVELSPQITAMTANKRMRVLILDNFDRMFKYSASTLKGDWDSLQDERSDVQQTMREISEFAERTGAKLVITIQDETYYQIRADLKKISEEFGKEQPERFSLGVPEHVEELGYLYNLKYNNYIDQILKSIFNEGIDFPLVPFFVQLLQYYKDTTYNPDSNSIQHMELELKQLNGLIVQRNKVDNIKKMLSRLGLSHIPDETSQEHNMVIIPGEVLRIIAKLLADSGISQSKWQKLITYFILGTPLSLGLIFSIIFALGLSGEIKQVSLPLSCLLVFLVIPPLAVIIGYFFNNLDKLLDKLLKKEKKAKHDRD